MTSIHRSNHSSLPKVVNFNALEESFVVAGPCSAETPDQVLQTARALSAIPSVKAFRAGIWKPRTRPNAFEGHGEKALPWLQEARLQTGLPLTIEVANAYHTQKALEAGIDILWIGARTTVNPFSVQEIAEVLRGVDIPVMVKNPVTPDLPLWLGAIERLQNVGLTNLAAIHRGFTSFEKTAFRNAPEWSIPIDFKRLMPGIPLLCDPSHMGGNRSLLLSISQKALDLDYAGLMIESHPNPDVAWSDAQQQITPQKLSELLSGLRFKRTESNSPELINQLELLRSEIDILDERLLEVLARRMNLVQEIGEYKKENNLTILQVSRWRYIFEQALKNGSRLELNEKLVRDLYKLIHLESIRLQETIIHGPASEDQP